MYWIGSLLIFLLFFIGETFGKIDSLRICVVGNPSEKTTHTTKYCNLLQQSKNSPVSCVYESNRLECLRAVSERKADFSVFEPEDLYFSTLIKESSILVVSEIRAIKKNPFHYEIVVLVRAAKNITSLNDLSGKSLCHPGTENGFEWPDIFSQYFEERVAPSACDNGVTSYEDRIKTSSVFFGSACKAGPWVIDSAEDEQLKQKYPNLCSLCDSGDCRLSEKYHGSGGSITCFKDKVGDLLWARYEDVKIHLKINDNSVPEYSYLCDDGSTMAFSTEKPCVWLAKPWQVVVANRKSAIDVQKIMEVLKGDERSEWQENLLHIIELYLEYVENLPELRTSEDYLRSIPGYLSASSMSEGYCNPKNSVKLCVSSSLEYEKCDWMSKAASALGITPSVQCVQKTNMTACLNSVAEAVTDLVVVPPDYFYDATLKFNLKTLLVESGSRFNESYLVLAAVHKNSNVQKFADLKGKKACFTKKNGIGWISALMTLHDKHIIDSACGDETSLLEFFSDVCVLSKNQEEDEKLITCCSNNKTNANLFFCLKSHECDVAFVDLKSLKENADFRTICRENNAIDCQWMWSNPNYLMVNNMIPKPKIQEVRNVFIQLGQVFGRNSRKSDPMFKIFGLFDGVNNVLFQDSSSKFVVMDLWNRSNNFKDAMRDIKLCSGSMCIAISNLLLFFTLKILFFFFFKE